MNRKFHLMVPALAALLLVATACSSTLKFTKLDPGVTVEILGNGKLKESVKDPKELNVSLNDRTVIRFLKDGYHPVVFKLVVNALELTPRYFELQMEPESPSKSALSIRFLVGR